MAYGTIKVDNITFDNGGVDKLITVSGLFYSTSGALTVTGAISGGSVTAPTATFTTLTGTTTAGTTATFTSGSFTSLTGVTTTVTSGVFGLGSAAAPSIAFSGDPNTGIYSPGADQVGISTGGTGRVFVDSSGNVGVGVSSPQHPVHIDGTSGAVQFRAGVTYAGTGLDIKATENSDVTIDVNDSAKTVARALVFSQAGSERMRIDSSGNVGIGTSSPQTKLHVLDFAKISNSANSQGGIAFGDGNSTAFNVGLARWNGGTNAAGAGGIGYFAQGAGNVGGHFFYTGDAAAGLQTERMRIDSSGNVGIGVVPVSSQGKSLQIATGVFEHEQINTNDLRTNLTSNAISVTPYSNTYKYLATGASATMLQQAAGQFRFYNAPSGTAGTAISFTQAMTLDASGKLLLGTTQNGGTANFTLGIAESTAGTKSIGLATDAGREQCRIDFIKDTADTVRNGSVAIMTYNGNIAYESLRVANYGTTTLTALTSTAPFIAKIGSTEVTRIDSSGRLLVGTSSDNQWTTLLLQGNSNSTSDSAQLRLCRGTTTPAATDTLGAISFSDSSHVGAAIIQSTRDGGTWTSGTSQPTALLFSTTASGSTTPTERMRIDSVGTTTLNSAASTAPFIVKINTVEVARIDGSGRFLFGSSIPVSTINYAGSDRTPKLQVIGDDLSNGSFAIIRTQTAPSLFFGGGAIGTNVVSGNSIGSIVFTGYHTDKYYTGASIDVGVDGTPGANDMPGRLVFSTTADGAATPTERLRITNDGVMCHDQPAPATYAAAATLTVADLKTGIITYTGGAATLTLPTGTLTEGGFAGIYTNMTFEWSVINTGAGICTIGAGTAHTIVGSGSVAIGASARFTSRRTAANTFISYRLS